MVFMRCAVVALTVVCACEFSTRVAATVDAAADIDDAPDMIGNEVAGCAQNTVGACPVGYVLVPNNCEFGAGEFCIAKYEAKVVAGAALSTVTGTPTGNVTVAAAKAACAMNGAGYHLVTNEEWMAVARAIEATPVNWSTTTVPFLSKGNTDACGQCPGTATCPSAAAPDNMPCTGTKVTSCTDRANANFRYNRTARIGTSGGVIWDLSGNMFELIDFVATMNATQGEYPGRPINMTTGASFSPAWPEAKYKSANTSHTDDPSMGTQEAVNNVGLLYVTSTTMSPQVTRGGDYCGFAGIYAIGLLRTSELGVNVGFRCAYR
jgi:hypothetical protein